MGMIQGERLPVRPCTVDQFIGTTPTEDDFEPLNGNACGYRPEEGSLNGNPECFPPRDKAGEQQPQKQRNSKLLLINYCQ